MECPVSLHDKNEIEAFLRHNPWLHLYALGDLDEFFWPYTTWYAPKDSHQIKQLALLYTGTSLPVLLGLSEDPGVQALLHSGVLTCCQNDFMLISVRGWWLSLQRTTRYNPTVFTTKWL